MSHLFLIKYLIGGHLFSVRNEEKSSVLAANSKQKRQVVDKLGAFFFLLFSSTHMASISRKKNDESLCTTCESSVNGVFTCSGCSKSFCAKHAIEHRLQLGQILSALGAQQDLMHEIVKQQCHQSQHQPLFEAINEWEVASILKIRKAAEVARAQVLHFNSKDTTVIAKELVQISEEMKRSRENEDFIEVHLMTWKNKLEKLKKELEATQFIIKVQENQSETLVRTLVVKAYLPLERFDTTVGDIHIKEGGFVAIHRASNTHGTIRGRYDYSSGSHQLQMKIEALKNKWVFFGIVSGKDSMHTKIYDLPSVHGWDGYFQVAPGGKKIKSIPSCEYFWQQDDIADFVLDCDQKAIRLTNTRTELTREISVDIERCPLPWRLLVSLIYTTDSVRLVPS